MRIALRIPTRGRLITIASLLLGICSAIAGCSATSRSADDDDDAPDGSDTGSDTAGDCTPGQRFCVGNEVHDCTGPGNEHALAETCVSPLICVVGQCVENTDCGVAAAKRSNVGCEYWAADLDNWGEAQTETFAVVVSNITAGSSAHVQVHLREAGSYVLVDQATIEPHALHAFNLTGNEASIPVAQQKREVTGTALSESQAYRITSDKPVVAYQFNPLENNALHSNDASLLIAKSGLDRHYWVLTYPGWFDETAPDDEPGYSTAQIIAVEDGTTVTVRASAAIEAGSGVAAMAPGEERTFTLNAADMLQLESAGDLSATRIVGDRPLVVFGSHKCAFVPNADVPYCDHLESQLFPESSWGSDFVVARSPRRMAGSGLAEADHFRILAATDGTELTSSTPVSGLPATLDRGEVLELVSTRSFDLAASHPVIVGQFLAGHEATGVPFEEPGGDPTMALVPPVEQWMSDYVVLAPDKYELDYVVLVAASGTQVDLNGTATSGLTSCAGESAVTGYDIYTCLVADGAQVIHGGGGIGVTVFGYSPRVSYGYTGGLDLEAINDEIVE